MVMGSFLTLEKAYPPVVLVSDSLCHRGVLPEHELYEHHG